MEFPEWNCHDCLAGATHFSAISSAHTCIPASQQRAHASSMQILDALRSDHALYACVHLAQLKCVTAHFGAVYQ